MPAPPDRVASDGAPLIGVPPVGRLVGISAEHRHRQRREAARAPLPSRSSLTRAGGPSRISSASLSTSTRMETAATPVGRGESAAGPGRDHALPSRSTIATDGTHQRCFARGPAWFRERGDASAIRRGPSLATVPAPPASILAGGRHRTDLDETVRKAPLANIMPAAVGGAGAHRAAFTGAGDVADGEPVDVASNAISGVAFRPHLVAGIASGVVGPLAPPSPRTRRGHLSPANRNSDRAAGDNVIEHPDQLQRAGS